MRVRNIIRETIKRDLRINLRKMKSENKRTQTIISYFAFLKLPLTDDRESSVEFKRTNAKYSATGRGGGMMSLDRGQRKKKRKKGAEGCCASLAMYAARVIPRDVYAKERSRFLSLLEITPMGCEGVRSLIALNC